MKLIEKMIVNRMNVASLLFLFLMASCTLLAFFNGNDYDMGLEILFPLFVGVLLIFWLVYSSIGKKKLVADGLISKNHSDMVEELGNVFKPNSKIKKLFAAWGLTVGIFILLAVVCVAIEVSPDTIEKIVFSNAIYLLFVCVFIVSYLIVRRRIK